MKNVIKATVVSVGFALATASAWAQFAPNMAAAAVKAQVQQQMAANVAVESIVEAAMAAGLSPEAVIDAVLASTPADQLEEVVSKLAVLLKDNPDAIKSLATASDRNPQLALTSAQLSTVLASVLSPNEFQLAGLADAAGLGVTPSGVAPAVVNSLFGANGPAGGTGGGRVASPN